MMKFTREEVLQIVIDALREAQQEISDTNTEINEKTKPIGGLKDFDSLASVDVTIRCFDALQYDDPFEIPTLFIDKHGKALTVGEVVDRILDLLKKAK